MILQQCIEAGAPYFGDNLLFFGLPFQLWQMWCEDFKTDVISCILVPVSSQAAAFCVNFKILRVDFGHHNNTQWQ